MRDFDLTYGAYAEFQRGMERYWSLRWLRQEGIETIEAGVKRDNLVKLDRLPLVLRVPSLPAHTPGPRVRLAVETVDFLTLELSCRYIETLEGAAGAGIGEEETEGAAN
jgi:exoribonuclease-2